MLEREPRSLAEPVMTMELRYQVDGIVEDDRHAARRRLNRLPKPVEDLLELDAVEGVEEIDHRGVAWKRKVGRMSSPDRYIVAPSPDARDVRRRRRGERR
jgi:hypothetical protein